METLRTGSTRRARETAGTSWTHGAGHSHATGFLIVAVGHLRSEVSAEAWRSWRAWGSREARLSRDAISARGAGESPVSFGAGVSLRTLYSSAFWVDWGGVGVGTDGAALSEGDLSVGAVGGVLADHLVAEDVAAVADTDLAGLRFPHILVVVREPILYAASSLDVLFSLPAGE